MAIHSHRIVFLLAVVGLLSVISSVSVGKPKNKALTVELLADDDKTPLAVCVLPKNHHVPVDGMEVVVSGGTHICTIGSTQKTGFTTPKGRTPYAGRVKSLKLLAQDACIAKVYKEEDRKDKGMNEEDKRFSYYMWNGSVLEGLQSVWLFGKKPRKPWPLFVNNIPNAKAVVELASVDEMQDQVPRRGWLLKISGAELRGASRHKSGPTFCRVANLFVITRITEVISKGECSIADPTSPLPVETSDAELQFTQPPQCPTGESCGETLRVGQVSDPPPTLLFAKDASVAIWSSNSIVTKVIACPFGVNVGSTDDKKDGCFKLRLAGEAMDGDGSKPYLRLEEGASQNKQLNNWILNSMKQQ